jgi:hypothetical protein
LTIGSQQTLAGSGQIGISNGGLAFNLTNNGTILANQATALTIANGPNPFDNKGHLQANNRATLNVSVPFTNEGTVHPINGTINANGGFTGTTGTAQIDAAGTLAIGANSTVGTLKQNGTLALGTNSISVSTDYNNANFKTGNSFDKHAGVTGTGQILAAGPTPANMQVITDTGVSGGNTTTPTLALGNVHVGDSATYQIANQGAAANPSLRGAIQTNNGGNINPALLTGNGVTPGNFGPIAPSSSSRPLTVTVAGAGSLSGQAVHIANNFDNVSPQTISITGAAYNLASSNMIAPISFGVLHVGDPTATRTLSITNTAPAGAFSEGLDSGFGLYGNNGGTLTPSFAGSITNLAAGSTNSSNMTASLGTATAGSVNGTITIHQASNGTISGLSNTALADQTPAVTGTVQATITNLAVPQVNNTQPIAFGNVRIGTAVATQGLSVTNAAPSGGFSEGLIGAANGASNTRITSSGGFGAPGASLAPQATNTGGVQVGINTNVVRAISGNALIDFKSDGTGFSGGTVTDLGNTNVAVTGAVFRLAPAALPAPSISAPRASASARSAAISASPTRRPLTASRRSSTPASPPRRRRSSPPAGVSPGSLRVRPTPPVSA